MKRLRSGGGAESERSMRLAEIMQAPLGQSGYAAGLYALAANRAKFPSWPRVCS